MAQQCLAEGAPLQTLLLLLGGATAERSLAAAAAQSSAGVAAAPEQAAAAPWQQPGMFNPASSASRAAGGGSSGAAWRRHLAVMAANRTPGDEAPMALLGSHLLAAGHLVPAHTCFALAGTLLQPWDMAAAAVAGMPAVAGAPAPSAPGPPLVLLGADAVGAPRTCAQLPAILATEVYTWTRTVGEERCRHGGRGACSGVAGRRAASGASLRKLCPPCQPAPFPPSAAGNTQLAGAYLAVLPYTLLHAAALAELGLLPQASAYCTAIHTTLQVRVWWSGRAAGTAQLLHPSLLC